MAFFLDRIDAVPISDDDFTSQFSQWLWVLVDTLNEDISGIQVAFNFLTAPNLTAAEIVAMNAVGLYSDGIVLYDTTNNEYVGRQNGALVKFTTTVYP